MLTLVAETTLECRYDTGITLSWLLHPTGWTVGGISPNLDAVISATGMVVASYSLVAIACAIFGKRGLFLLPYADKVYAHFEIVVFTCAARVAMHPSTHPTWACVLCAVVALVCVVLRAWTLWRAVGTAQYVPRS